MRGVTMDWFKAAGVVGALGVALGAFGAHGLEGRVSDPAVIDRWWRVGAHYHLIHALALAAVAAHPQQPAAAGWLFLVGILLFSGSLYVMTLTDMRALGMITPLGGLAFIAGWLVLAFARRP